MSNSAPSHTFARRQAVALEMIAQDAPLGEILAMLCHIVEAEAPGLVRAAILLVDAQGHCLRTGAAPGLPDTYNQAVDGIGISSEVGTCAAAAALGDVVVTTDIASDPRWEGLSHLPLRLGFAAAWSMPILATDRRVIGTFGTYFVEPREPTPAERALVGVLTATAALAIERAART